MNQLATTMPRILCVDDEPNVLSSLKRVLRRDFDVVTAEGSLAGLEAVRGSGPFSVVVSDLRMPQMDGAEFLGEVKTLAPETTRILLTGNADVPGAIAAVNQGAIFRFLRKPCPGDVLTQVLHDAHKQYELVMAERVLLEQTLRGSISVLADILSLANPAAFGHANRIKKCVLELATMLGAEDCWHIEVAAVMSQVGMITLPAKIVDKLYRGETLAAEEQAMADRIPALALQLIEKIPRLEPVREVLVNQTRNYDGSGGPGDGLRGPGIPLGARLFRVARDFDALQTQGASDRAAIETLRGRKGHYDPEILDALAMIRQSDESSVNLLELPIREIVEGMIFADEVRTIDNLLLVARGQAVTTSLLARLKNYSGNSQIREPIRVIVPAEQVRRSKIWFRSHSTQDEHGASQRRTPGTIAP